MTLTPPPADPAAQLAWLVDRAAIADIFVEFARALDQRDWDAYANLYAVDGAFSLAGRIGHTGRAGLADFVAASLSRYQGTWHLSSNYDIDLDGDRARARHYGFATHLVAAGDDTRHIDGGGWYDSELVRTPEGWKFARVTINEVWTSGEGLPGETLEEAS